MGRPETIICARCDASVTVKPKGPVPSYCADCRRSGSSKARVRPEFIQCERCGADVAVRDRGPLPRHCREGCKKPTAKPQPHKKPTAKPETHKKPATAPAASGGQAIALRPWDRPTATSPTRARASASPAGKPKPVAIVAPTSTRIATAHPAVGAADLSRAVRVGRLRHAVAVFGWIAIVLLIALIVFVGSRPAATSF